MAPRMAGSSQSQGASAAAAAAGEHFVIDAYSEGMLLTEAEVAAFAGWVGLPSRPVGRLFVMIAMLPCCKPAPLCLLLMQGSHQNHNQPTRSHPSTPPGQGAV